MQINKLKLIAVLVFSTFISMSLTSCQKDIGKGKAIPSSVPMTEDWPLVFNNSALMTYLPFENNIFDSAVKTNMLIKEWTVPFAPSYVEGIHGKGYNLDGKGAIYTADTVRNDFGKTGLTVSFWMKVDQKIISGQQRVIFTFQHNTWTGFTMFQLDNTTANNNDMPVRFSTNNAVDQSATFDKIDQTNPLRRLPDMYGKWKHIAVTYTADGVVADGYRKITVYVDGIAHVNKSLTSNPTLSGTARLVLGGGQMSIPGATTGSAWYAQFIGSLDQFRLYKKVLSPKEIKMLYESKI